MYCTYVAVAFPVIVFVLGRHRWFFGDEWSFLAERDGGNVGDLFRSHGEHWSTVPVLVYRGLWRGFALRTYVPYQAAVAVVHLVTALLLRVVMRRAGVAAWTATVVASGFVLFGPGQENILWAFQIGFVSSLMFGLGQLILSDHDGRIDRRDVAGLFAGAAGLMCSGVALPMVVVVGMATFLRRGWKVAAFHVGPLVGAYAIWYVATSPGGIENPYGRSANAREIARFVWSGVRGTFVAVGAFAAIGLVLAIVVIIGVSVAWVDGRPRTRFAGSGALLTGALVFLIGTSVTRWFVTPTADSQSRYIYTLAALFLPALAIAVDGLIRRWRLLAPILFALLLIATAKNATGFGGGPFNAAYFRTEKQLVLALSRSTVPVPSYLRPNPWYTIGWLRGAATRGEIPAGTPPSAALERDVVFVLSIAQLKAPPPATNCGTFPHGLTLRPRRGERFGFRFSSKPPVGANYLAQDAVFVTSLGPNGKPRDSTGFVADFGRTLEIERGDLTLRFTSANAHQPLVLCHQR